MDKLPKRMTMGNVPVWFGIWSSMVTIMIMIMIMVMVMVMVSIEKRFVYTSDNY